MKNRSLRISHYGLLFIVVVLALGACKGEPSPEPPVVPTPAASPTPVTEVALPVSTPRVNLADTGESLAPRIISWSPKGGKQLPQTGVIEVIFDQPMDQAAVAEAWQLVDPDGIPVVGEVTWSTNRTLIFKPGSPLSLGVQYQALLGDTARSLAGISLSEGFSFQVQTVSPLAVSQVLPANGARDIESTAIITVIFNQPVVPLVPVAGQAALPQPLVISPPVDGVGKWLNTSVYIFRPSGYLRGGVTYTARVEPGLTDMNGSTIEAPYEWSFSVAQPSVGELTLLNLITNPPNDYRDILLGQGYALDFRQAMDRASVQSNLSIRAADGSQAPLTFVWNESDTTVVLTPTQLLRLETQYTLELHDQAQARDGGQLARGISWSFTTIRAPGIRSITPADGSVGTRYDGFVDIQFNSPMQLASLSDRVILSPAPPQNAQWYYDSWGWRYSLYGLDASTRYTLEVLPGARDIYGNEMVEGRNIQFTTGPYEPSLQLQMPYEPAVFRAQGDQEFYIRSVNVRSMTLNLYQLDGQTLAQFQNYTLSPWNYRAPTDRLIWSETRLLEAPLNKNEITLYQPAMPDGSRLPEGVYYLTVDSPQVRYNENYDDSRIFVVSSATITMKYTMTEAFLWLTDLETGAPLSNFEIAVFDHQLTQLASGVTRGDGTLSLPLSEPTETWQPRFAMIDDGTHFAFASTYWGSGVSPYEFGIWGDFYTLPNQPTAYIYTDRPIYRPGQPVFFKGVIRMNDDLQYSLPPQQQVMVTITSFDSTVYQVTHRISEFGSFQGQFILDNDAALGYYNISTAFAAGEDSIGSAGFTVASYRRPDFQVNVAAIPDALLLGDAYDAEVSADFFFGGGVAGANVDWTLYVNDFTFSPEGELSLFSFTDQEENWYYYDFDGPPIPEFLAQGSGITDDVGDFAVTLTAVPGTSQKSREYTFEASVTDLAGTTVSSRTNLVAHQSEMYVGVRPVSYVGQTGKESAFEIVAVDWDATPLPGERLSVQISERRWYSVQEQDPSGYIKWTTTVEDVPVAVVENVLLDGQGRAQITFTPPNGGVFKATVTGTDSKRNQAQASAYMWVWEDVFIAWRQTDDKRITLIADKPSYVPGETADILIASPFQEPVYALVTVERGHIRSHEVLRLENSSTLYRLLITADMAPNVFLSVMLVKGAGADQRPDFRMGLIELEVDRTLRSLQVEIRTDKSQAGPGDDVTFTVITRDSRGAPVQAEVSLALVDLATLSLAERNTPLILDHFYGGRSLSVQTVQPILFTIESYNEMQVDAALAAAEGRGMGSGGGKGDDELGVFDDIRQDFPDTAYWRGQLVTGSDGTAQVAVKLPDNLTTWRMDARAVTLDTRVGETTSDLVSTKPLLVRPQTPRFFVSGDEAFIGAAVHNNTADSLEVNVTLATAGAELLQIENGQDAARQVVLVGPGQAAYVTWRVRIHEGIERVDFVFSAQSGLYRDVTRPVLATLPDGGIPVYRYDVPEIVGTAGLISGAGMRVEGIGLLPEWDLNRGQLTVQLIPSLAASMLDSLTYQDEELYSSIEHVVSGFLPNILTLRALELAGLQEDELREELDLRVNQALQRLANTQKADGGWGWWGETRSDVRTTAYVLLGLSEARAAGYSTNKGLDKMIDRASSFLRTRLLNLTDRSPQDALDLQAFALFALVKSGNPDTARVGNLFELRQGMSLYGRALLARSLAAIDTSDARLAILASDFMNAAILSASGAHWEEGVSSPWSWNTDTRTTAIVLGAMLEIDPANQLNANAVRWLMTHRQENRWRTSQETAWVLMAFSRWIEFTGEMQARYDYGAAINGTVLGEGTATPDSVRDVAVFEVLLTDLLPDELNRLVIARSEGQDSSTQGVLYYSAHLKVFLPVSEVEALDQGIMVSRAYYRLDGSAEPVTQVQQGELLYSRLTIVVPSTMHFLAVDDPIPAGFEIVDQSLETSIQSVVPNALDFETFWRYGYGWWSFDRIEIMDDRTILSARTLAPGTYIYNTLVRASFPGTYQVIPPTAVEVYFPEVYGRGAGSVFEVTTAP